MLVDAAASMPPAGVIYTAVTALVGAVVALFRLIQAKDKEHAKQIAKKSEEHAALSLRVGKVEGKQDGIETLSKQVLETVHNAITEPRGEPKQ